MSQVSRRGLLSLAGVGGVGAAAGLAAGFLGHDAVAAGAAGFAAARLFMCLTPLPQGV